MNGSITPHNYWLHPKAEKLCLRGQHTEGGSRGVTIHLFSRCICVVVGFVIDAAILKHIFLNHELLISVNYRFKMLRTELIMIR